MILKNQIQLTLMIWLHVSTSVLSHLLSFCISWISSCILFIYLFIYLFLKRQYRLREVKWLTPGLELICCWNLFWKQVCLTPAQGSCHDAKAAKVITQSKDMIQFRNSKERGSMWVKTNEKKTSHGEKAKTWLGFGELNRKGKEEFET